MKKYFMLAIVLGFAIHLTGCETVKGVGRDITNTSDGVQNALFSEKKK